MLADKVRRSGYKMQEVKFASIEEFLAWIPDGELVVVEFLRKLVYECDPTLTEKLFFNVPAFKKSKNLFFIWPASVKWGMRETWQGVRFGFSTGYLLQDETGYLETGNRKQVYWRDFKSVREIDTALMRSLIFEALAIEEAARAE